MFKFNKKSIIYSAVLCLSVFIISSFAPSLGTSLFDPAKHPLKILNFVQREIGAIVFYHRNFTRSQTLQKQVDFLKSKLLAQEELNLENKRLTNLLSLKQKSTYKLIAARVIAHSPDSWSSTVIIDKGKSSGIKRGLAVITYLGLVGRVADVSGSSSKVMLISDPNIGVSAMCQRSRQEGLVSGTLGANLIMRYLPEGADIIAQDIIITSGLSEFYPNDLLIGTVIEINKDFSGLSHYAIIKPAVNLANIEEVLVVIQ